jgi:two-component system, NarL family, sensor histidine kinase DesK
MNPLQRALRMPVIPPEYGRMPYMWLFTLAFVLWKYLYIAPTAFEVVLLVATGVVFLPVYFFSYWAKPSQAVACVLFTCVLGTLWAQYGFSNLFIFACAMCGRVQPVRRAYQLMAFATAVAISAGLLLSPERTFYLMPFLIVGVPVGISAISDSSLRRSRQALMRKQEEVEHIARIAERERISRDLHDLLGHSLSMIALKAELARKLADRDIEACRKEIADIENAARTALSEVRSAVTGYRQSGLVSALANARASLAAASVELDEEVQQFPLAPAKEHVLALALSEAVTNVVRHAGATRCKLGLVREGSVAVLRVVDDGRGRGEDDLKRGNGLTGMQERASAAGGSLSIRAASGLTLELRLPLGECA